MRDLKPGTIRFQDIPQLTGDGRYQVNVSWDYLEKAISEYRVDLEPDFQRGHVWTKDQRIAYVENRLRGETSSRRLQLNVPGLNWELPAVLVDGKQRLTAVRMFLADEIPAFGYYRHQFTDKMRTAGNLDFIFCVHSLQTRAEVLKWYLELNSGGVVHTNEELERVRALLDKEQSQC